MKEDEKELHRQIAPEKTRSIINTGEYVTRNKTKGRIYRQIECSSRGTNPAAQSKETAETEHNSHQTEQSNRHAQRHPRSARVQSMHRRSHRNTQKMGENIQTHTAANICE